jgi:antitoxin MazE
MTTTIQKWGNSQGIRIPKVVLEHLNLDTNSEVLLLVKDDSIIIKKATKKKHLTIEERFANYTGKPQSGEYDWGEPQGKELW